MTNTPTINDVTVVVSELRWLRDEPCYEIKMSDGTRRTVSIPDARKFFTRDQLREAISHPYAWQEL